MLTLLTLVRVCESWTNSPTERSDVSKIIINSLFENIKRTVNCHRASHLLFEYCVCNLGGS